MPIELLETVEGAPSRLAEQLNGVLAACLAQEGVRGDVSVSGRLVDDAAIRALNREFRGVDRETDVLSFPAIAYESGKTFATTRRRTARDPETNLPYLGDFALSLPRAQAQADAYGHSLARELGYLTAHSLLHLMGYDHETEAEKRAMRQKEEAILTACQLARPDDEALQSLYEAACAMLVRAYAPYSQFRVGACLLSADGRSFTGCNIENASFGTTICAERVALAKAVSEGARRFTAIAVVGEHQPAWPCGICRQALYEFAPDMIVLCGSRDGGSFELTDLAALLPHGFGPGALDETRAERGGDIRG